MTTKEHKIPGPDHPITITPSNQHFVVKVDGAVVADSTATLTLQESTYPPAQYFPRADLDQTLLRPSSTTTFCPYKGDASYFSVAVGDRQVDDAIWSYADPYPEVKEIAGYVAFYPDRVEITSGR
jgi:uncharacterized protein (DUF427 family)